jgi:two-component system phosphate regulon sensor histidine kinase PhoR
MIFRLFRRMFMSRFEKMRREFTANVSHELKTPLHSISGAAELLKSGVVNEADRERFIDMILAESRRMTRIIGDIIAISELDCDARTPEGEDVDFVKLVRECVESLRNAADEASVRLTLSTPLKSERWVYGSPHFLEAIVSNLIVNAINYNKAGGVVDVKLVYGEDHLTLTVADTGIGIEKAHHGRIFERFYRVDKGRSRKSGGTGLGLSIVRNAVRLHKGEVTLESVSGKGSTFTVALPYNR